MKNSHQINESLLYIDGSWINGCGDIFSSYDPFFGKEVWKGRAANQKDIDKSVDSASRAFFNWSELSFSERSNYLKRFVKIVKSRRKELAEAISVEIGKPLWESLSEVDAVIGKLEPTMAAFKNRVSGIIGKSVDDLHVETRFVPHGPVAVLGPYNLPAHIPNGQILPALLAGNCVVYKPSEYAPLVGQKIAECWNETELPRGVFNLIQGRGNIGNALCSHKEIRGILFTGSLSVGQIIANQLANSGKIVALELGGNNPLIIWDPSDLRATVFGVAQSAFITAGQRCSSCKKIIVQKNSLGKKLVDTLAGIARNLRFGSYLDRPEAFAGPLVSKELADKLFETQTKLLDMNEIPVLMARRSERSGNLVTPAIMDATKGSRVFDDEVLGPLVRVIYCESFDMALEEAGNTQFGLAAGVFSGNRDYFEKARKALRFGIVNWNRPITANSSWASFGGVGLSGNYRPSGYLAGDYCVYAKASMEQESPKLPNKIPPGIQF